MEVHENSGINRRAGLYAGLSALLLVVVACTCGPLSNLPGVGGSAAATPTLIGLDGGSTTGGDGGTGSSDTFNFVDPDKSGLKTYRSEFKMTYSGTKEDGTPASGTFDFKQAHTTDPLATSIEWTGEGEAISAQNEGGFQMIVIGDTTYMVTQESGTPKCISMNSAQNAASVNNSPGYSPDTFLSGGDMSGAKRVLPDEIVNGVLSQHWQFTKADVSLLTPGWTNYTVDAWTAVDGGYAVKSLFVGDGDNVSGVGGKGHVEWEFNLLEANTDITIAPPDGCEAPAGADLPQMPDAADGFSISGMSSYSTASSVADVVAFYQAQMPAAGWTAGESSTDGPVATLTFTKDGKTATITVTQDSGTGKTTVLIQIQ